MNSLKSKIAQLLFIAMVLVLCCGNKNYISELNDKITNTKTIWEQPREATVDNFEVITFGNYYINDVSGMTKEPIEWLIMKKEGKRALLLSRYVLDHQYYDDRKPSKENFYKPFDSNWVDSSLRKWLNDYFYKEAFSEEEKSIIQNTYLDNTYLLIKSFDDYEQTYLNTMDKVFILSIDEMTNYETFSFKNRKLTTRATEYAKNHKVNGRTLSLDKDLDRNAKHQKLSGDICPYWIRTSELSNSAYSFFTENATENDVEKVGVLQSSYGTTMGVRPAIWVNFDGQKYKELKNEERIKQQQQIVIRESAAKSRVFDLATFSAKIESLPCVNEYPKNTKENEIATVQFGNYYYTANRDRRDIDWMILKKDPETRTAILITRDIIESEPYDNRTYEQRYWENCSLRIFLNTTFYNEAFTDTEKVIITDYVTTNYTGKNQYGESVDKVSLLNDYKVKEYFLGVSALAKEETNNAKALITPYALSKSDNELDNKNGYGRYWLRDLNMTGSAESLNPNGRVTPVSRDYKQYKKVGVRPIVQVVY